MFMCPRSVILNFDPNWKLFQFSVNCKRPLENTREHGAKSQICLMSPVMLVLITGLQHPLSGSVYFFSACFRVFARKKYKIKNKKKKWISWLSQMLKVSNPLMDCVSFDKNFTSPGTRDWNYFSILFSPERCFMGWKISSWSLPLRRSFTSSMLRMVASFSLSGIVWRSEADLSEDSTDGESHCDATDLWSRSLSVWRGSKQVVSLAPCWNGTKGFLHPEICLLSLFSPLLQFSLVAISPIWLSCFSL